jgi:hypothetical protein
LQKAPRIHGSHLDRKRLPPPADIKTEVFFILAASIPEKEGCLTNTQWSLTWPEGPGRV